MNEFWQTLLIAVIPSVITALISFFAALKSSNTQIRAIKEQNKADIEMLISKNRADLEALKEKHHLDIEMKEKEYIHQIEMMKIQYENELKKDENTMKNQVAINALGSLMSSMLSKESPIAEKLNEVVGKSLEDALRKQGAEDN